MKFTDITVTSRDDIVGWADYFASLYSPLMDDSFDSEHKVQIESQFAKYKAEIPSPQSPFLYSDIEAVCRKLKNGKAPGFDGIESEPIKYGGAALTVAHSQTC